MKRRWIWISAGLLAAAVGAAVIVSALQTGSLNFRDDRAVP